jgi:hypothetical protein
MKLIAILNNCWRRLLPTLAVFFVPAVMAQGIVYVHAPLSNPNGDPNHLPWDSLGTQVGSDFPIVINGQTVLTFSTPQVLGQPSAFVVHPSSLGAVIAFQPNVLNNPLDPTTFPIPLSAGTEIGSDAAGYSWLGDILGGDILTASIGSGIIGEPFLTDGYFTGLESAYLGFDFQQDGETYYGWVQLGCPVVGLNAGWIYDYAYETTPNTPITAGAVPEPSTWALLVFGGAFYFLRRR